jgi:hypothetical protein
MTQMILQLFRDPHSGRRDIVVDLRSDVDATPLEHEHQHRALVDGVFQGGTYRASSEGRVVIDRFVDLSPVLLGGG